MPVPPLLPRIHETHATSYPTTATTTSTPKSSRKGIHATRKSPNTHTNHQPPSLPHDNTGRPHSMHYIPTAMEILTWGQDAGHSRRRMMSNCTPSTSTSMRSVMGTTPTSSFSSASTLEMPQCYTRVLIACETGDLSTLETLLTHHPDLSLSQCVSYCGYTPLHYAVTRGHVVLVRLLLTFFSMTSKEKMLLHRPNALGECPIHLAADRQGSDALSMVHLLLDYGADGNALTQVIDGKRAGIEE